MEDLVMRFNITLQNQEGGVLFPFNYNEIITSLIYNNLVDMGVDLDFHDSKDFKFFTFSNIIFSKFEVTKDGINSIDGIINFQVSSPDSKLLRKIINGFIKNNQIMINGKKFLMTNLVRVKDPEFSDKMEFKTMSPIIVNSYKEINGKMKNWDLSPTDEKFFPFIERNLIKKYNQFFDENLTEESIKVSSEMKNVKKKRVSIKRDTSQQYYVGYMMDIILEGDSKVIKFAYDCGLSNKNSMGFGMIKPVRKTK